MDVVPRSHAGVDKAADAGIEVVATKVEEVAVEGAEKVEGLVGGLLGGVTAATDAAETTATDAAAAVVEGAAQVAEAVPSVSVEAEVGGAKRAALFSIGQMDTTDR